MRYLIYSLDRNRLIYGTNLCSRNVSWFLHSPKNVNNIYYFRTILQSVVPGVSYVKRCKHLISVQESCEDDTKENARPTPVTKDEDFDFTSITNGDPVLEKKLKILFLEAEVFRQSGGRVPEHIGIDHWKELLQMDTRSRRRKYMAYLFGIEKKKESRKLKKELKKKIIYNSQIEEENDHIAYGLGRNSIFQRIYDNTITQFHNSRLIQAMLFEQKLVVDCSYDAHMNKMEAMNCGKQLMLTFSENRVHDKPFDLQLCNVGKESICMKTLVKIIPTLYDPDFPLNITEKSYLDLFPKEKIVYLTPHCREVLDKFDHDAVYVVGAMVDKTNNEPLSLAKAKREGLKMAKLPLDNYLLWGSGASKSLTLNQIMSILLEIRMSGDWNKAFEHIPRRKLMNNQNGSILRRQDLKDKKLYSYKISNRKN